VAPGDPARVVEGLTTVLAHVAGTIGFDVPTIVGSATGGDTAYDGPFWKTRSPLEVVDSIDVPAFVVGGHHDLFQRGEPLIYERLKQRVPARLLMGRGRTSTRRAGRACRRTASRRWTRSRCAGSTAT
jgi:hypothetical protein